jgi:hypothetical protein
MRDRREASELTCRIDYARATIALVACAGAATVIAARFLLRAQPSELIMLLIEMRRSGLQ